MTDAPDNVPEVDLGFPEVALCDMSLPPPYSERSVSLTEESPPDYDELFRETRGHDAGTRSSDDDAGPNSEVVASRWGCAIISFIVVVLLLTLVAVILSMALSFSR